MLVNDLSGRRFGRLFVWRPEWDSDLPNQWHCRCLCGKSVTVDESALLNGEINSCGCLDGMKRDKPA